MHFNVKDAIENQIYFHLSIQIESAEESAAKQPEGITGNPFVMYVRVQHEPDSSQAFARVLFFSLFPPFVALLYPPQELPRPLI